MANNFAQISMSIGDEWPVEAKEDLVKILNAIEHRDISLAPSWYGAYFDVMVVPNWYLEAYGEPDVDLFDDFISGNLGGACNADAVAYAIGIVQRHYEIEAVITFSFSALPTSAHSNVSASLSAA
ncbi:MAG: hypothetical protein LBC55_08875 [Desulfovibrio sp.]|jgi:hypothetical protein|nr:hypothetical protein [Desulfovibrio sp.]